MFRIRHVFTCLTEEDTCTIAKLRNILKTVPFTAFVGYSSYCLVNLNFALSI